MPKAPKSGPPAKLVISKEVSSNQAKDLLSTLKKRFEKNMNRHVGLEWKEVEAKLKSHPEKLLSIYAMETTGGEPDVVGYDGTSKEYIFSDCSAETPKGRVNVCYDLAGEKSRKFGVPAGNAIDIASDMGVEILDEEQYRELQKLGIFDTKTSSWLLTPPEIRKLGGAIFADYRYGNVFVYHNGAQSFYANRGFRGWVRV